MSNVDDRINGSGKTGSSATTILFLAFACIYLLRPVAAEQDFWWHLATGKWIWQQGTLPTVDPFSLLPPNRLEAVQQLTLKGFWLSQVVYFLLYSFAGLSGICILGAAIMAATLLIVWRTLRLNAASGQLAAWCLLPLVLALNFFSELRPQQFSFLCFAAVLHLLETSEQHRRERGTFGPSRLAVPPLIIVWAQLHPGYAVVYPLLAIYFVPAIIQRSDRKVRLSALLLLGVSIAAGMAAPAGPGSLVAAFRTVTTFTADTGSFARNIVDYHRPWDVAFYTGPWYWRLLCSTLTVTAVAVAVSFRRLPVRYPAMVACYGALALTALRFGSFFFITASLFLGQVLLKESALRRDAGWLRMATRVVPLLIVAMLAVYTCRDIVVRGWFREGQVSDKALQFLLERKVAGPVGNPYTWGGYMIWRVWPEYRVFMDQRNLSQDVGFSRYSEVMFMSDTAVLDHLAMNSVIMNSYDAVTATIYFGFITLMESGQWHLVYADGKAAIFVRDGHTGSLPVLDKRRLVVQMAQDLKAWQEREPGNPTPCLLRGQFFFWQGDFAAAREGFEHAAAAAPGEAAPKKWLQAVDQVVNQSRQ